MKHFAVYDTATGTLRRHGSCMAADFALQPRDGEAVIEIGGPAPGFGSYVDVTCSPPVLVTKPSPDGRA